MGWKWWKKNIGLSNTQRQASRKLGVRLSRSGCGFAPAGLGLGAFLACVLACGGAGNQSGGEPTGKDGGSPPPAVRADPLEKARERWAARVDRERPGHLAALRKKVDEAESGITAAKAVYKKAVDSQVGYSKQQALKSEIGKATARRDKASDAVAAASNWEPLDPPDRIRVGWVGKTNGVFLVLQVIGPREAILAWGDDVFWVEANTAGLTTDARTALPGLSECVGTTTYHTPLGTTRTVLRIVHHGE